MSTSQRSGRSSSNGKSNGRISFHRKKRRVGTPGRPVGRGVEFEAAVLEAATPMTPHARGGAGNGGGDDNATVGSKGNGSESEGMDTFSYEDVSNLATVTPAVRKRSVSRVAGKADKQRPGPQGQEEQLRVEKGKKRSAEDQGQAEAGTEEENGSRAAKRRKQRQQEAVAAAAAAAAAPAPSKSDAATPNKGKCTATPTRSKENTQARGDSNGDANGGAQAAVPPAAGGITGVASQEATAAGGAGSGGNADEPRGALSPKRQEQKAGSKSRSGQRGKGKGKGKGKVGDDKRGGRATKSVRKVPPYPRLAFEAPAGEVRSIADALRISVTAEVQGLLRKRGNEPECKVAVETCLEAGKEAIRRTAEVCDGLVSEPRVDTKVVRRVFSELRQRMLSQIAEEEELWAIEEQKCMALAESNKRAKAKVQAFDERQSGGHVASLAGGDELRALIDPVGEGEEEEEDGGSGSLADGTENSMRVGEQVLEMTNDMLANVSAISGLLQEMGAGVADAQETKERLAQVFGKVVFKNYPNVHDPKAGIAAILK